MSVGLRSYVLMVFLGIAFVPTYSKALGKDFVMDWFVERFQNSALGYHVYGACYT